MARRTFLPSADIASILMIVRIILRATQVATADIALCWLYCYLARAAAASNRGCALSAWRASPTLCNALFCLQLPTGLSGDTPRDDTGADRHPKHAMAADCDNPTPANAHLRRIRDTTQDEWAAAYAHDNHYAARLLILLPAAAKLCARPSDALHGAFRLTVAALSAATSPRLPRTYFSRFLVPPYSSAYTGCAHMRDAMVCAGAPCASFPRAFRLASLLSPGRRAAVTYAPPTHRLCMVQVDCNTGAFLQHACHSLPF